MNVGSAARATGWSPRMLRYVERLGLVVPARAPSGYRRYDSRDVELLTRLRELRARYGLELSDVRFALRLRTERALRASLDAWLSEREQDGDGLEWQRWEQRKHERLLLERRAA